MTVATVTRPRFLDKYRKEVIPALMKEFEYSNSMQVPRIQKIVINMGVKEAKDDIKILDQLSMELSRISGQKPVTTYAKKSISNFKVREGSPIGLKVTLRRNRMYEFMDRLCSVAMPRIRDFQGFSPKSFDGNGNYTFGLQEQSIFPEVEFDKIKKVQGMDITFVTSAKNDEEARKLLEHMGFPFKKSTSR
jgi:large subunit ribosomal protein L5